MNRITKTTSIEGDSGGGCVCLNCNQWVMDVLRMEVGIPSRVLCNVLQWGGGGERGEEGGSQLVDYVMFSVGWGVGVGCVRGWGVIISLLCKTTCPTLITTPLKRLLSFLDWWWWLLNYWEWKAQWCWNWLTLLQSPALVLLACDYCEH